MSDPVSIPEEAVGKAARASFYLLQRPADKAVKFEDLPQPHIDGWLASAREGLVAAAPLIVAGHLQALLDEAFPDEDPDYHYGCERLLDLVRDSIPALRGEGQQDG